MSRARSSRIPSFKGIDTRYAAEAKAAYDELQFTYDYDDNGLVGEGEKAAPGEPVIMLSDSPTWFYGHRGD